VFTGIRRIFLWVILTEEKHKNLTQAVITGILRELTSVTPSEENDEEENSPIRKAG
jgi:hypothetical protein